MIKNDKIIATLYSSFKDGDTGLKDAVSLRTYNTNDYAQMLSDAIALANTSLLERD